MSKKQSTTTTIDVNAVVKLSDDKKTMHILWGASGYGLSCDRHGAIELNQRIVDVIKEMVSD